MKKDLIFNLKIMKKQLLNILMILWFCILLVVIWLMIWEKQGYTKAKSTYQHLQKYEIIEQITDLRAKRDKEFEKCLQNKENMDFKINKLKQQATWFIVE